MRISKQWDKKKYLRLQAANKKVKQTESKLREKKKEKLFASVFWSPNMKIVCNFMFFRETI